MKVRCVFWLVLKDGRRLFASADNEVDAFNKMRHSWPLLVEGYSWRDLICS